jgi:hypothetical protein
MIFGPLEILGIVFIILKLTGVIAWSWWWVCSPIILAMAGGFLLAAIVTGNGISQGKSKEEIMQEIKNWGRQ